MKWTHGQVFLVFLLTDYVMSNNVTALVIHHSPMNFFCVLICRIFDDHFMNLFIFTHFGFVTFLTQITIYFLLLFFLFSFFVVIVACCRKCERNSGYLIDKSIFLVLLGIGLCKTGLHLLLSESEKRAYKILESTPSDNTILVIRKGAHPYTLQANGFNG